MESASPSPARSVVVPHVHVRVRGCAIAVALDQVRQALPLPPHGLAELPRRSGGLLGMADMDGAAVPVVALERWLPMQSGAPASADVPRVLVLEHAGRLVGLRVDAVQGVRAVAVADIRTVHHTPDDNELFESVVPAAGGEPMLCLLEVPRLMRLSQAWCEDAAGAGAAPAAHSAPHRPPPGHGTQRHAVFRIGSERWAVPVAAVQRVVPVPAAELVLGRAERIWAISQWQGRKLPLVDISQGRQASNREAAPWMAMLGQGALVLGLTVSVCEQFVDLADDAVAPTPNDPLTSGLALLPDGCKLQILDVARLFGLTPGASISRAQSAAGSDRGGAAAQDATEPVPYLVFDADQRYASPVGSVVGVVALPPEARDDLRSERRAILAWRGHTVPVVSLPAIARSAAPPEPLLAVLVQTPGSTAAPTGIAIRSLCDWLPAHSVRRSGMRMGAMGEFGMINAKGAIDHTNLVEVDLAQMAHLLG